MKNKYENLKSISLPQAQELSKRILAAMHSFCIKHNITYYIMFGTLLGAVRHHDTIPWDHDIDTIMIRSEYNKFLELSDLFFKETGYKIINYKNQKHMPVCFSRIIDEKYAVTFDFSNNNKINDSLYIDIFVLDKGPSSVEEMDKYYKTFAVKRWILSMKYNYYQPNFAYRIIKTFFRLIFLPFSCKYLCDSLIKKANNPKYIDSNNVFVIDDYFRKRQLNERYLLSDFGTPKLLKFGELEVYAPNNYERILKNRYGNYLELPPEDKRKCYATFFER